MENVLSSFCFISGHVQRVWFGIARRRNRWGEGVRRSTHSNIFIYFSRCYGSPNTLPVTVLRHNVFVVISTIDGRSWRRRHTHLEVNEWQIEVATAAGGYTDGPGTNCYRKHSIIRCCVRSASVQTSYIFISLRNVSP